MPHYHPRHEAHPLRLQTSCAATINNYVVVIAARNEESAIADTIRSVFASELTPSRVLVVVNNTTDNTARVAREAGAEALVMVRNEHKKAGALNYGLDYLGPTLSEHDAILVMDADTTVSSDFARAAIEQLNSDKLAGGVSSIFVGRPTRSFIGTLQQMEYHRYRHQIKENGDQAYVLSGTASVIRWTALQAIKRARRIGRTLPPGDSYYDVTSLTEDNELTFALRTLGWTCPAPGATSTTDVMESTSMLYHQRHRWYLGALQNIWGYGRKLPWDLRLVYWRQQVGLAFASIFTVLVLVSLAANTALFGVGSSWLMSTVLVAYLAMNVGTVWRLGWKHRLIALAYVPELAYNLLLQYVFIRAAADHVRGHRGSWHAT